MFTCKNLPTFYSRPFFIRVWSRFISSAFKQRTKGDGFVRYFIAKKKNSRRGTSEGPSRGRWKRFAPTRSRPARERWNRVQRCPKAESARVNGRYGTETRLRVPASRKMKRRQRLAIWIPSWLLASTSWVSRFRSRSVIFVIVLAVLVADWWVGNEERAPLILFFAAFFPTGWLPFFWPSCRLIEPTEQ